MRRQLLHASILLAAVSGACSSSRGSSDAFDDPAGGAGGDGPTRGESRASDDGGAPEAAAPPQLVGFTASQASLAFLCKVLNDKSIDDPTANQVQTRFNIAGTDLGIPVVTGDDVNVFFGDTIGYKQIWPAGQGPDSVAHIPLAGVKADPSSLCRDLSFYVTDANPSVAHGSDPTIERDFAGAYMQPPAGETIDAYVAQPAGPYPNIPGVFEVPSGGFSQDGKVFVFYAGYSVVQPRPMMRKSYIARWDTPGSGLPIYQILRPLDMLDQGPLGGHFIQVSPVVRDDTVYLFGTGDYRRTGVYVARAPVAALTQAGPTATEEIYDPQQKAWKKASSVPLAERPTVAPTTETEGVGELSATWIEEAKTYVLLYQREIHDASGAITENRVIMRFAPSPEGPWTDALTVIDGADPAFQAKHCCATDCTGDQILHCDRAGLYAAYLLPGIEVTRTAPNDQTLDIPFFVSTWDPYDVVVFHTSIQLHAVMK